MVHLASQTAFSSSAGILASGDTTEIWNIFDFAPKGAGFLSGSLTL